MAGLTAEAGEGGLGFLLGSVWNEMRREALDRLLEKRSEVRPHATQDITLPAYPAHTVGQVPALAARFANAAQCPAEVVDKLQYLIFPIAEAETTCITEDFSEYQRHAPGVFFFLGTGGIELHAPTFTFPEEILDRGEALLCGLV